MKSRIVFVALAFLTTIGGKAQTVHDAFKLADRDLNGTARFVGMGGAMGVLGGDPSVMITNPAGIALYRGSHVTLSGGFRRNITESRYQGQVFENHKNHFSLDDIGAVLSMRTDEDVLRFVNIGFNYTRSKSFYKNMSMEGVMGSFKGHQLSQVNQMAQQATDASKNVYEGFGESLDFASDNIFSDVEAGWLGAMGYQGALLHEDSKTLPYHTYQAVIPGTPYAAFHSKESGGIDQFDVNFSFNIKDRFYLGLTLGAYDVKYRKSVTYAESYETGEGYALSSYGSTKGSGFESDSDSDSDEASGAGFDVKLGVIVRPFADCPLRIGFAIHSPVYYRLYYSTNSLIQSQYLDENNKMRQAVADTYKALDQTNMETGYRLRTPWKYNLGIGYTLGNFLALGLEYEYENYSTMKFHDTDGHKLSFESNEARMNMKGVGTYRIGLECKPIPQIALRLGYNYITAAFKENAVKYLPANSLYTDTSFANAASRSNYTLGIGYHWKKFYVDMAYQLSTYKEDFYPFYNEFESSSGQWDIVTPEKTTVTNTCKQVLVTLGMRF